MRPCRTLGDSFFHGCHTQRESGQPKTRAPSAIHVRFTWIATKVPRATSSSETRSAKMSKNILIVDDNATIRVLASATLSKAGFLTTLASTAPEALSLLQDRVFDLIIVDYFMPDMMGDEFVRLIRQHEDPAVRATPVLGLSGSHKEADALFAKAGVTACIRKPFIEERLVPAVVRILGGDGKNGAEPPVT